jgi:hypothetical protein
VKYATQFGVPKGLVISTPSGYQVPITGGNHKRSITKEGIRIDGGVADGAAHNWNFRILNPSNRLRCAVEILVEDDDDRALTPVNMSWQLRAVGVDARNGRRTPMQLIYGPATAPDGFELDSEVEEIFGTVFMPATTTFTFPGGEGSAGIIVQATWEPSEFMPDDEFFRLLAGCNLWIEGQPKATNFP